MSMAVLSLVFLFFAIACGYFLKTNTGFLAIALAVIIGSMGNMGSNDIIKGFSGSLFIMMLGVNYLFSISLQNGTLDLVARKIVSLAGKHTNLIPIIVFFIAAVLAGVGPGTVPVMALMAVFTMALAASMKINPVMLAAIALLGAQGGGLTPMAPTGILCAQLASAAGFKTGITEPVMVYQFVASLLYATLLYFVFGGYKIKQAENDETLKNLAPFNKAQLIIIAGMVFMVILVLGFKVNAGLAAFLAAAIIMFFKVADEKKAIAGVPWGTLLLVTGVNVLMNVVIKLGGIKLLSGALATIMTPTTATPIIGLTAGIMSWFSSTSGVVMPTLIPTVAELINAIGGDISPASLISAIVITAHTAGCSPLSTGGALALAAYCSNTNATGEEQQKLFIKMFAVAVGGVVFMVGYAFLGGFYWFK